MITAFLEKIEVINDFLFGWFDNIIESIGMPDWACDAVIDSFHTIPFLFIVFVFIELFEYYWAEKLDKFMKTAGKAGPIIGSLAAIVPQCGFSIIASSLYANKLVTRGTLIAIYLATSDEALPVLVSYPEKIGLILPVVGIKILVAITAGYLVDLLFKSKIEITKEHLHNHKHHKHDDIEEGCCKHDIITDNKINLWLHPMMHTLNVFVFVLVITLILNFFISDTTVMGILSNTDIKTRILEPILTALVGLIPNCAISIALTMLLIKGSISFGAAMAGLCANGGLGLLVLLRKNKSFKDSILIIVLLYAISVISGYIIDLF